MLELSLPMSSKRTWFWVFLVVCTVLLAGMLATSWNVVLMNDYRRVLDLSRWFPFPVRVPRHSTAIAIGMAGGTLGFAALLAITFAFFLRLLKEMSINRRQSEFLATVTHELKTPIAALELSASLIRNGGLSEEELSGLWCTHETELGRLRREVEALLEAARWQMKPGLGGGTPIRLEEWLRESMDRWKAILGPDARVERTGPFLGDASVPDRKTLNLISDNLVDNARKFSDGAPWLTIRTSRVGPLIPARRRQRWRIEFEDHGLGFDPENSGRIFERFVRAHEHAPYAIPGTGLGLYLARSAARALGIRIAGESAGFGKGARFILEEKEKRWPL